MSVKREPITYRGRNIGILVFTIAQLFIGAIHIFFGILLLAYDIPFFHFIKIYDVYTVIFGLSILVFAVFVWQGKKVGWIGTVAVSIFVLVADTLTVLNLHSVPGIPMFAPPVEIPYSLVVIFYLTQKSIRQKYLG
jgi:hypothetical protein